MFSPLKIKEKLKKKSKELITLQTNQSRNFVIAIIKVVVVILLYWNLKVIN